MPEISLLNPTVLRGVVEKFTAPETLVMLNRVDKTPWPYPSAVWDVITGSRMMAKPNVPNSEAHIVPRLGRSQESASFIYLREKKVFEPTTLHWIRTPGQLAARNAEAAVMREVGDLNQRFDNFAEFCIWKMFTGTLTLDYPDVQASIDYKIPTSHKPGVPSTVWTSATPASLVGDIRTWKRLIARDGRVPAREAYATEKTISYIFDAYANTGSNAPFLLSDRMKDQYYSTGTLPNFMGLNWHTTEHIFEDDSGNDTLFLADNAVLIGNFTDNRPYEMFVGPTADDEAPEHFTGKFAKTWKDKDPSARQYLLEWHFLPVITRPEQFVYVASVV